MTLQKAEHDKFHQGAAELNPKRHEAPMKRLGVTREQDEDWHRTHLTLAEQRAQKEGLVKVNPFAVGGGFLGWCVKQGWLVQQRKHYFATKEGAHELAERFAIEV
jgi:hypothetical protein